MEPEQQHDLETRITDAPLGSRQNPFIRHHDEAYFGDPGQLLPILGKVPDNVVQFRNPEHKRQEEMMDANTRRPVRAADPWYQSVLTTLATYFR